MKDIAHKCFTSHRASWPTLAHVASRASDIANEGRSVTSVFAQKMEMMQLISVKLSYAGNSMVSTHIHIVRDVAPGAKNAIVGTMKVARGVKRGGAVAFKAVKTIRNNQLTTRLADDTAKALKVSNIP